MADSAAASAFAPVTVGTLRLRNRFIKSATKKGMAKGGLVTRGLASFDENVAGGGGALTTIAYCATGRDGRSFVDQATPADAAIADCRAPAAGVHRHAGAVPFSAVACITGVALPVNGGKAGRMVLPE